MIDLATTNIRLAQHDDIAALVPLVLQLYHADMPGALRGSQAGQLAVVQYVLARGGATLFRRYVAVSPGEQGEQIVATASLRLYRDRVVYSMPPGLFTWTVRQLGFGNALRLFGAQLRAGFAPDATLNRNEAFVHSVVVDASVRRQGIGALLLGELERLAWLQGARSIGLRVSTSNQTARRLYQRLGYRVIRQTPPTLEWLTAPSDVMQKPLLAPS